MKGKYHRMPSGGNSCLDEQIERLKRCEYLREGEVKALCLRAREILVDESNVQRVDAPVTVSLWAYYHVYVGTVYLGLGLDPINKFVPLKLSTFLRNLNGVPLSSHCVAIRVCAIYCHYICIIS